MRISNNYNRFNSFKGAMTTQLAQIIKKARPAQIESKLSQDAILSRFSGQKVVAGLSEKTVELFKSLKKFLPPQIETFSFGDDASLANCFLINTRTPQGVPVRRLAVGFNLDKMNLSPEAWDKYCDGRVVLHGTNHILNPFCHEFIHSDYFKRIINKIKAGAIPEAKTFDEFLDKSDSIPMDRFIYEIITKIGKYGAKEPSELHSVYWARELCDSLDERLVPKYNPFENPKIELSQDLRKFITLIDNGEIDKAKKLAMDY